MPDRLTNNITKVEPDFAFRMFALTESAKAIAGIEDVARLFAVRETINDSLERRENGSIFEKLRLVLTYTASTSRIFWPAKDAKPQVKARCLRLRRLVGLPEDHALSERKLRNHIEHFDERLDGWLGESARPFTGFEFAVHHGMHESTVDGLLVSVPVLFFEDNMEIRLFGQAYRLMDLKASLVDVRNRVSRSFANDFEGHPQD